MSPRYSFDRNPARAVKLGLMRRGIDVIDTDDDATATLSDAFLLACGSAASGAVHARPRLPRDIRAMERRRRVHHGIVYVHMQRMSIGDLMRELERLAGHATPDQLINRVVYLPWSAAT
jgi:hypothetical protein